uniref:Uncharacterized protein n=1 Tax=Knipowitschia caucasica TaxID=637954 RepID=A0AAV2JLN0_KNICA
MLGDIGRHGTGPAYERFSKLHQKFSQRSNQNFTQDNRTQGIMEKSQWDLKKIRFHRRRVTRTGKSEEGFDTSKYKTP